MEVLSLTVTTLFALVSAWRAPETFIPDADGKQVVTLAADVFMFGCFMLEVLTGSDPWWFMSDGSLKDTRYPPRMGEVRHTQYRPDANPLDDAKAAGKVSYLVKDPPAALITALEAVMRQCFAVEPAARPDIQAVLAELQQVRQHSRYAKFPGSEPSRGLPGLRTAAVPSPLNPAAQARVDVQSSPVLLHRLQYIFVCFHL